MGIFNSPVEPDLSPRRISTILEDPDSLNVEALFNRHAYRFLKMAIFLCTVAFIVSASRIMERGWHPNHLLQGVVLLLLYLLALLRNRLPRRAVSLCLLTSTFFLGVSGLVSFGLAGGGIIALFAFSIFAGMLYGTLWGVVATGVSALAFGLAGLGAVKGVLPLSIEDTSTHLRSASTWLNIGTGSVVLLLALLFCIQAAKDHFVRAIRANKAERDFARAALDAQSDLFFVVDPKTGTPIRWNRAVRNLTGCSDDQIAGSSFPEGFRSFVDVAKINDVLQELVSGRSASREIPVTTRSGRVIPIELNATQFRPSADDSALLIGIGRDISERKAAEKSLRESEQKYRLLIENVPVVFWMGNREMKLTYVSPNVTQVYGFTDEELMAGGWELWQTRVHEEDRRELIEFVSRFFTSGAPGAIQFRFKNKAGNWMWLRARCSFTDDDTTQGTVYGIWYDITEQVHTAEKLHQTEKMHAIGQLAGGIAHDFNNQLSAIMTLAELLLHQQMDSISVRLYAEQIRDCVHFAAGLTTQLLTYARKGNQRSVPIDVHRMTEDLAALLRRTMDKRIEVHLELNARHPLIVGDPAQIQNTLLNLSLNAHDAMPKGGRLTFETTDVALDGRASGEDAPADLPPGKYIRLRVTDSGIGMEETVRRRMFDPFFTTKPEGKGTGMGLAMAMGCIRSHRGDITVASAPGQGTAMTIYLPIASGDVQTKSGIHADTITVTRNNCGHILLVDDETSVCKITADMLRRFGFDVQCCLDGRDAVRHVSSGIRFDVVVLDLMMPDWSGEETLRALHQVDRNLKVLISTVCERDERVEAMIRKGAKGYIQKPFTSEELFRKVDETLSAG